MRLVADENMPGEIVRELRAAGHDVLWVAETNSAATDPDILRDATADSRLVITADRHFGDLAIRRRQPAIGIILVRWRDFDGADDEIASLVTKMVGELEPKFEGQLTVLSPKRVRHHSLT